MTTPVDPQAVTDAAQDVISELRNRYDELTNSQKRIAETIVEDPEFVAFATVDKFAARLGVSPSTIVRFAYRIGLAGYPELQEQVRELVLTSLRTTGAAGADPFARLGASVTGDSMRHDLSLLTKTAERLNADDVERAVEMIVGAERVRVIGGVTAFSVAYYTAVTLERIRSRVTLLSGSPVPTGPLLEMEPSDVLIAFSFPPYARTTIAAIDAVKKRGASVVAISDSPISPVRGQVDILLPAAVSGIGTQNSLVAAMSVANVLVNGVASRMPGALERYSETIRLLDDWDVYLLEAEKNGER
jgi:DNA-binding MurR/RpiR family transcriptional regulator